jgi:hypothetical protein
MINYSKRKEDWEADKNSYKNDIKGESLWFLKYIRRPLWWVLSSIGPLYSSIFAYQVYDNTDYETIILSGLFGGFALLFGLNIFIAFWETRIKAIYEVLIERKK